MKNIHYAVLSLLTVISTITLNAQDCANGIYFKEGSSFEMQSFNAKDKLQSSVTHVIKEVRSNGASMDATLISKVMDDKGKPVGESEYEVKCNNGIYEVNMNKFMDPAAMKSFEEMQVTIEGNNLEMPAQATAGTKLNDGNLKIIIEGPFPMTNTVDITNRTVEGNESITTPAGTFDCIKISYDVNAKFVVKVKSRVEEWYSPGTGVVLSKNYDSKGKLQGYTQLTKLSN